MRKTLLVYLALFANVLFAQTQKGSDIDGEAADDQSGLAISMSSDGNIVANGAMFNDGNGNTSGHARVYKWNGSAWSQMGNDIDGEDEDNWSGRGLDLSSDGTVLAIGEDRND